jgi:hypothetical protein
MRTECCNTPVNYLRTFEAGFTFTESAIKACPWGRKDSDDYLLQSNQLDMDELLTPAKTTASNFSSAMKSAY